MLEGSWNSIIFADGSMSRLPRATCEIQGYVYDAKIRSARLAREFWDDPALADRLEREAAELKRRFNADFWLADREFFALAIDGDGGQVDSLTSNIGHLLWSGIVDDEKADACAASAGRPALLRPACGRWRSVRAATTRSATTSAPSGRTTTR